MNTTNLSLKVTPSNPAVDLHFQVELDNLTIFTGLVNSPTVVSYNFDGNTDGEHTLKFILSEKKSEHTIVDENNNIVTDAVLTISNIEFDEIDISQICYENTVYTHDFNGTQSTVEESFFGTMGCNGTVELKFSTPIYLWMLENL